MPKEKIESEGAPQFAVTVAWNREQTVQLTTVASDADERLRNWTEIEPGVVHFDDAPAKATKPGTSFTLFDGWHVDLDRTRLNELIRVLRRARDQAFGRDE